jgi:RimJ/RimL family protein N-acetyltransferase
MGIQLRPVEKNDAHLLLRWENDPEIVAVSPHNVPYTIDDIQLFIDNQLQSQVLNQFRYMICLNNDPIGTLDLCDISINDKHAFVGVLIAEGKNRQKGYAKNALIKLEKYAKVRGLTHLYAWIHHNNLASRKLFESVGYKIAESRDESLLNIDDYLKAELHLKCLED